MDSDVVIRVENVSKKFSKSLKNSMFYGIKDIVRNMFKLGSNSEKLRPNEFWSVNDISFEVKRGETLGLIGPNGSGKTTLLKMLNGIFWPDKGKITVKGRVGALIAVGAGFHPMFTGRENIYINGAILGMNKREINKKLDAIVDFADIGDFLDSPVKHYSSGMFVRLGFAVAVHCETDILLIDEVLSVGDINFQAKCMNKIKELDKKGITKIYVSHDLNSVELLCKQTIYLSKGRISYYDDTRKVIDKFKKDVLGNRQTDKNNFRYGTKEVLITNVEFLDDNGVNKNTFWNGESLHIKIHFNAAKRIKKPEFAVGFYTKDGILVSFPTTRDHNVPIDYIDGEGQISYCMESIPLNTGKYAVSISCWDETGHIPYDHHEKLYEFAVQDCAVENKIHERFGLVYIPSKWRTEGAAVRSLK